MTRWKTLASCCVLGPSPRTQHSNSKQEKCGSTESHMHTHAAFSTKEQQNPRENMLSWRGDSVKTLPLAPSAGLLVLTNSQSRANDTETHKAQDSGHAWAPALRRLSFKTSLGYISKMKQINRHWAERWLSC